MLDALKIRLRTGQKTRPAFTLERGARRAFTAPKLRGRDAFTLKQREPQAFTLLPQPRERFAFTWPGLPGQDAVTLPQPHGRCAFTFPKPRGQNAFTWRGCSTLRSCRAVAFSEGGFTLFELLVVMGIIAIMMVLIAPAVTSIKTAGDVTNAAYTISGLLEQARAYAMANNTFVWVGFKEVDASKDSSISPQIAGIGRLAIAIVASRDGTRGYDTANNSLSNPAWTNYNKGANLVALSKLQRIENVHLATTLNGFGNQPPTSGNMARPYIQSNNYVIGNAPASVTPFDWPLGSALNAGQYSFQKVVNFDGEGIARIQYSTNTNGIGAYMEVGLQQAHGTVVPASTNVAALQIDCMTGATRKYRP